MKDFGLMEIKAGNNSLLIKLTLFDVEISPYINNDNICFTMKVMEDNNQLTLYFDNLEETLDFTYNEVDSSFSLDEVNYRYQENQNKKKKLSLY